MTVEDVIGYLNGRIKITHKGAIVLDFKLDFKWDCCNVPFYYFGNNDTLDQLTILQRVYVDEIRAERKNVFVVEVVFDSDEEY